MVWLERRHLAFAVANCVFNLRFAVANLRRIAGEARNMTENALSILIVIFSNNSNKPRSQRESCLFSTKAYVDKKANIGDCFIILCRLDCK